MGENCNSANGCADCPSKRAKNYSGRYGQEGKRLAIVSDFQRFTWTVESDDTESRNAACFSEGIAGIIYDALQKAKIPLSKVSFHYASGCKPPTGNYKHLAAKIKSANRRRKSLANKAGVDPELIKQPAVACRSTLMGELRDTDYVICLGKLAAQTVLGKTISITARRGSCETIAHPTRLGDIFSPTEGPKLQVGILHDLHFLSNHPGWHEIFHNDFKKALQYFNDTLAWEDPTIRWVETADDLERGFLELLEAGEPVVYDVETDSKSSIEARFRCSTFSNKAISVLLPWRSRAPDAHYLAPAENLEERYKCITLMEEFFTCTGRFKEIKLYGHNAGQYDRTVIEKRFGFTPTLEGDTLLYHLLADNEKPHNLGFCASVYTDNVDSWKADHTATTAKSDRELHLYCAMDGCANARIIEPLQLIIKKRNQVHLIEREKILQHVGVKMYQKGMGVDLEKLQTLRVEYSQKVAILVAKLRTLISNPAFNPNSTTHLGDLIFREWGLKPCVYSKETGEPSLGKKALIKMVTTYGLSPHQLSVINTVREYRKVSKVVSTYLNPMVSWDRTTQYGYFLSDGRVHPSYNRLPATGRYSSSEPNAQNQPYLLRAIYAPAPGHCYVGADADQLELRGIAEEADAKRMLGIINSGADAHNETMRIVYGEGIWNMDGAPADHTHKGSGLFSKTRGVTKNVRYAWQYSAGIKTIHETIISVEDKDGTLPYGKMQVDEIRRIADGLKEADPEIPQWWDAIVNQYRRQGYIADTIWGRRRDFLDEQKPNGIINHPIQSGGASIIHEAMIELLYGEQEWFATTSELKGRETVPEDWLINQCHDSLLLEPPDHLGNEVKEILQAAMNRRRKVGAKLTYTAEADVGYSWDKV